MKKFLIKKAGITLIALIITIIVLLILAGVTIASLTGEYSVIERARMSRNNTQREGVIEQAKMDIMSFEMDNLYDHISKEQLKQVLDKYFKDVPSVEELPNGDDLFNLEFTTLDEYGNNTINVYEIYNGKIE